jgi:hypothetical protein
MTFLITIINCFVQYQFNHRTDLKIEALTLHFNKKFQTASANINKSLVSKLKKFGLAQLNDDEGGLNVNAIAKQVGLELVQSFLKNRMPPAPAPVAPTEPPVEITQEQIDQARQELDQIQQQLDESEDLKEPELTNE